MGESFPYLVILLCLLFSAFFSGMEIAFISSDKLHIEVLKKKGNATGKILAFFSNNQSHFLATILVGNNIALVLYGVFMANILEPLLKPLLIYILPMILEGDITLLIFQSVISTALVLLTSEFLPKSLVLINSYFFLRLFAFPMVAIYILMFPFTFLALKISVFFIWIFGYKLLEEKPVFGLTDLNNYIKNNILNLRNKEEAEIDPKIFNNAIEFKTVKVRECMIPRTEIEAIDVEDSIQELKSRFINSGHSKILVYQDSIDDVIGYCHTLELFKKPENIKSILQEIFIVPETILASELLIQFITDRKSLALVVDEYGGTSGVITMEDVIEEIFGEIRDEYDEESLIEQKIDEYNFIFSGRHEIDYLNEKYKLNLQEGEYDTLGGLIFTYHEDIPKVNQVIHFSSFIFRILTMENNKIGKIKLTMITNKRG